MLTSFWSGLGGALAKQWAAKVLAPAFVFWVSGLALVWWHEHHGGVAARGWEAEIQRSTAPIGQLPGVVQGASVVAGLLLVAASAQLVERLTLPVLAALSGDWPWWLRRRKPGRRRRARGRLVQRRDRLSILQRRGELTVSEYAELRDLDTQPAQNAERRSELAKRRDSGFSQREAASLAQARNVLHYTPSSDAAATPTRLGDVLKTSEARAGQRYGLDTAATWTPLWLVLPEETRKELVQARERLENALHVWIWAALFAVWTPWAHWALGVAGVVPLLVYYASLLPSARLCGDLVAAAYDLHRMQLYDHLHLSRPTSPADERRLGKVVTDLLYGGLDDQSVAYVPGSATPSAGAS